MLFVMYVGRFALKSEGAGMVAVGKFDHFSYCISYCKTLVFRTGGEVYYTPPARFGHLLLVISFPSVLSLSCALIKQFTTLGSSESISVLSTYVETVQSRQDFRRLDEMPFLRCSLRL
jgi:hypothetical protein